MDLARMSVLALLLGGTMLSGCGIVAAGTVGGIAAGELGENDDDFDPFENTEAGRATEEAIDEALD